jgi:predicted glycosyl hydrolase (DUF1957 family)
MRDELQHLFGRAAAGAWLAERVWEPSLAGDLAAAGYEWTVLDDNHLRAASSPKTPCGPRLLPTTAVGG